MTISWTFIAVVAVITASIMEAVKKLPFIACAWRSEALRAVMIWVIAFALSLLATRICGRGFGVTDSWEADLSYTTVAFLLEKFLGEEFIHKVLWKSAGMPVQ